MAFYPDELSPIDRIRSLGKQTDSLPDIAQLKNRRQWKSLVLGKKDMGMNNFATIAEEKEEEISSDGSQGAVSGKGAAGGFPANPGGATNKKITFPKPRKYITSRVSDRKEEAPSRGRGSSPVSFASLGNPVRDSSGSQVDGKTGELSELSGCQKSDPPESKRSPIADKSKESVASPREVVQNYALAETPIEAQWNEAFSDGAGLTTWPRSASEKTGLSKYEVALAFKAKQRKSSGSSASSAVTEKREGKGGKKKGGPLPRKSPKGKQEVPSTSTAEKAGGGKAKEKAEKGKALNMKEVVNVYKNLAYGSKEEIKSFVENLCFVKDDPKAESDKNLLSMMNLKALENKIKNFTKKSGKNQEASTSQEKKVKAEKPAKRSRKAHIDRLARHKAAKVSAGAPRGDRQKTAVEALVQEKPPVHKEKRASVKDKEPWKYVGMESALDKTYLVYPAYPPSVNLKNAPRVRKARAKGTGKAAKQNKGNADAVAVALAPASKSTDRESKVKGPQVVVKPKSFAGGGTRSIVSGPASKKGAHRSSAMTVCTVKFRPAVGQKTEEPPVRAADQSLLVYLHGTKALHVKSPYSDKQFSRVKFFRKDERGIPLIKGIGQRVAPRGCRTVSVRNISLPGKLTRVRSFDLLDFDEDIQNITDFLRSQDSPERRRQEEGQGLKKTERWWPKESPKELDAAASRHRRRRRRTAHDPHPHRDHPHVPQQHRFRRGAASRENFSPDSIIDEISTSIQHLQYLPDTEDNRKMIGEFFDELDRRIEVSRNGTLTDFQKFPLLPCSQPFGPIPILGY